MPALSTTSDAETVAQASTHAIARVLPERWRVLARAVATGSPKGKAYAKIRPNTTTSTAWSVASRIVARPIVKEYIKRLQSRSDQSAFLSIDDKREFLAQAVYADISSLPPDSPLIQEVTEIHRESANGSESSRKIKVISKIEAIKLDNALAGHGQTSKIEVGIDVAGISAALGTTSAFIEDFPDDDGVTPTPAIDVESVTVCDAVLPSVTERDRA